MFQNILPSLSTSTTEIIYLALAAGLGLFFVVYVSSYIKLALFGAVYGNLLEKSKAAAEADEYGRSADFFFARALHRRGMSRVDQHKLIKFKNDPHGKNTTQRLPDHLLYSSRKDWALNERRRADQIENNDIENPII